VIICEDIPRNNTGVEKLCLYKNIVYLKKYVLMKSLCSVFMGTKKMHKGICMAWLGKEKTEKEREEEKRERREREMKRENASLHGTWNL
jgi:hypothetical protein